MSKSERQKAISVINVALEKAYPDLKVRKTAGGYILNQLIKAGYTNDKIVPTQEEIKEDLANAAFKCRTAEGLGADEALLVAGDSPEHKVLIKNLGKDAEDIANLVPQKIILSPRDAMVFAAALEDSKGANQRLRDLMTKVRPAVHYLLSTDGPLGKVACGDERASEPISMSEEDATCPGCKEWLRKHKL